MQNRTNSSPPTLYSCEKDKFKYLALKSSYSFSWMFNCCSILVFTSKKSSSSWFLWLVTVCNSSLCNSSLSCNFVSNLKLYESIQMDFNVLQGNRHLCFHLTYITFVNLLTVMVVKTGIDVTSFKGWGLCLVNFLYLFYYFLIIQSFH